MFQRVVDPDDAGRRLDAWLAAVLPDLSRARIQALLDQGAVARDGQRVSQASRKVRGGETYAVAVPEPVAATPVAQEINLPILFEDEHLIVLAKPAGLVVHPGPGHDDGTLVNAMLAHCRGSLSGIGGVARPGIVHRLDKDVSGVMVVAKHDRAHTLLSGQFTIHSIERVYEAIVRGLPAKTEGTVDRPLGRDPFDRKRMAIVSHGGKRAVTHWKVLDAAGTRAARMQCSLETGRTHQIRVHLSSLGHPILGDRIYGPRRTGDLPERARPLVEQLDRIALHARVLGFRHPITGEPLRFDLPPPSLFDELLAACRS
ncbi:MAG TPA: RluA family pseudouridine synthase [Geminicoccus sp.]|uniref:RluA family pseudouridine synthase n=1 Tax=Geminicoccus sp. TaxID=2024832 RepID=UPI002E363EAF|nr:RluA family pseudouridine synthase [Geminicoccus sp.]HEX2525553.1 RluA family pseudouridine synthase [Geminicoccus sp.]